MVGGRGWMMTFISETRKEKGIGWWSARGGGWEEKQQHGEEEGEKMLRLAPIRAGGGRRRVFRLRLAAAVTDGCVCACVQG